MTPVPSRDMLAGVLREGAQRLPAQAIGAEVNDWIERHAGVKNDRSHQPVVRRLHHPTRTPVTGVGPVDASLPRVLDRRIVGKNGDGQDVDPAAGCHRLHDVHQRRKPPEKVDTRSSRYPRELTIALRETG